MIRFFLIYFLFSHYPQAPLQRTSSQGSGAAAALLPARFKAPTSPTSKMPSCSTLLFRKVELEKQLIQDQANAVAAKMESDRLLAEEEAKVKRGLLREEFQARLKAMDITPAQYRHLANFLRSIRNQARLLSFGIALSFLGQRRLQL